MRLGRVGADGLKRIKVAWQAAIAGSALWPIHAGNDLRLERVIRAIGDAVIPLLTRALEDGGGHWAVLCGRGWRDVQAERTQNKQRPVNEIIAHLGAHE